MTLPFAAEIFDHIFSFLEEDRAALDSCSAAHPILSSLAERHYFVHIVIFIIGRYDNPGFHVPYLFKCLSERPYLATHVRTVTIDSRAYPMYPEPFEQLSTILSLVLPHAEQLSLHNIHSFSFPEILRSALLNWLRTPHVKGLSLRKVYDFPMAFLDCSRNLKSVKLDASLCNFDNCANTTSTSLNSLFLADVNTHDVIKWAEPKANSLVTLHATANIYRFPNLPPIFNACSESLKSLTLGLGTSSKTNDYHGGITSGFTAPLEYFSFNLSVLRCLEVVNFHANLIGYTFSNDATMICKSSSSLLVIIRLVSTAGPSLKRLVLNFCCTCGMPSDVGEGIDWKPLIQFCDGWAFPHLRVDLRILAWAPHLLSIDEVVGFLSGNKDLSRLVEQGSLAIGPLSPEDFESFERIRLHDHQLEL